VTSSSSMLNGRSLGRVVPVQALRDGVAASRDGADRAAYSFFPTLVAVDAGIGDEQKPCGRAGAVRHASAGPAVNDSTALATSS
jgi:hypothetical protein